MKFVILCSTVCKFHIVINSCIDLLRSFFFKNYFNITTYCTLKNYFLKDLKNELCLVEDRYYISETWHYQSRFYIEKMFL